ncbi:glycosyltransferase family 4 protein [Patiriisocius hiemis]|uniref:Glycosyltransferase family 4 protein n=1 Tax=Patiriisocius hiemis TaxID=3075604 RepID=A0ABU2YD04_9FLAO|nr:glycosyltransferase family 4 protein [Constantimarinum sp. W242]MDT0556057.1 glycosyltransferase family 4 protein [Constantimarinum sp. W242]
MSKKRKLLYIGNKLSKAGNTITSIETLGALLQQEGFEIMFSSSKKNKALRLIDMLFAVIKNALKVDYILIDTYSTQNFYYAVAVGNLARLFKIKYIPILRGGDLPSRLKNSPSQSKKFFGSAYLNIAPSLYLKEVFEKEGYNNLRHIPNTIEIKNYEFKLREKPEFNLLWVRSFNKIYNPKLAIDVVSSLISEGYNATLCMIGPDKDGSLEECKRIAITQNLPITFTGGLPKEKWIKKSEEFDIFINTTNFDNTPISAIEAMALGLPVISTNVGGLPYLLETNKDGILVPPNNSKAFVKEIIKLIEQPGNAQKLSKKARKKVECFDWKIVKHQWLQLLNQ